MITACDFLAGGGGVTHAMTKIDGMKVLWVLNHSKTAIRTNIFNHKGVKHYWADFYKQDEHEMEPVDFVWASIECTQHSLANGGKEKRIGSYTLGWELIRYIKYMQPFVLGIENVTEFKKWAPLKDNMPDKTKTGQEFEKWKNAICALGYEYNEMILNAADFGIPTRRKRYFAFFTRIELGMTIHWPEPTHNKDGSNGLKKWVPCKDYIDLNSEGQSIFGREFNPDIRKNKRHSLSPNTLRRIAGGIKKFVPDLYFIFQYYSSGTHDQSIETPLRTITVKDRHVLVKLEKKQFIQDYCRADIFHTPEEPVAPQLTRQTKQLVTIDKQQFLSDASYCDDSKQFSVESPMNTITGQQRHQLISAFISKFFSGKQSHAESIEKPLSTITCIDHNSLVTAKANFISKQYNSNGNPEANNQDINEPCGSLTTKEKIQFITTYFNSSNNPGSQNQSLDAPLGTILTGTNKKALITMIENGDFDFDIKMRFLTPDELSKISTFPDKYFTHPQLKLNKKEQVKLIGNAVPPDWAKLIIEPVVNELEEILTSKKMVI